MEWREHAMPEPANGEVLIKVAAAGINRADIMQRQGKYPPPPGASDIMGMEVAGEIVALGPHTSRWKIGDKVCALLSSGGYAEYAVAPESQCLPVPPHMPMTNAAALMEAIVTVYANIFDRGALSAGETVLVHGGSSGIGTTAIQLVKLSGAKIFVTARSDDKCAACKNLGADLAINYTAQNFVEVIASATNKRGVDIVLDMVGGEYLPRNLEVLAEFGRHISIATQKGVKAELDLRQVMMKRLTLTGSTLRGRSLKEKARLIAEVEKKIWPWVQSGQFKPLVHKVFPIKSVGEAHKVMESSAHIGKIALEVAA